MDGHPWLAAVLAALLAAAVAMALHTGARAVLRRIVRRENAVVLSCMLERTQRAAGFAWPLLAMQVAWAASPDALQGIGTVATSTACC